MSSGTDLTNVAALRRLEATSVSTDEKLRQPEWNDLRYFLELVRAGNPSAAGRRLKVDHTTVRRRVAALEASFQARLFSSRGPTYELTAEGDRLLKYVETMEAMMMRVQDEIASSDRAISGTVRLGASDGFGAYFLANRLAQFSLSHPELRLKIVILPQGVNLSNREADIAISLSPPNQMRQIVRKLTEFTVRVYSSAQYLEKSASINSVADLAQHRFINYIPDHLYAPELDVLPQLGESIEAHFESTSIVAQVEATAAGAGLCMLPDYIAARDGRLQCVLPDGFRLSREYWLVIHPEMINLGRVRTVIDFLVESVRSEADLFCPPAARRVANEAS